MQRSDFAARPWARGLVPTAACLLGLAGAGLAPRPAPGTVLPKCHDRVATDWGSESADEIVGTKDRDVIVGYGGADEIHGRGGNDLICAGAGGDTVSGGGGGDDIWGDEGGGTGSRDDDHLAGGSGADFVAGQDGADELVEPAKDKSPNDLRAGPGDDTVEGGADSDDIVTADGEDKVHGNGGADAIDAGSGYDNVHGGDGGDDIHGGPGDEDLFGDAGNDDISGDEGNELIQAGGGADTVTGDLGNEEIHGGGGNDDIVGDPGRGDEVIYGDAGEDGILGGDGNDTINAGAGDDIVFGGGDPDTAIGGDGADRLAGGESDDSILGSAGEDAIRAGNGKDVCSGGAGRDFCDGGAPSPDDASQDPDACEAEKKVDCGEENRWPRTWEVTFDGHEEGDGYTNDWYVQVTVERQSSWGSINSAGGHAEYSAQDSGSGHFTYWRQWSVPGLQTCTQTASGGGGGADVFLSLDDQTPGHYWYDLNVSYESAPTTFHTVCDPPPGGDATGTGGGGFDAGDAFPDGIPWKGGAAVISGSTSQGASHWEWKLTPG